MERKIKRGDIYYADLNPVVGSEQGGTRPVLIISNDMGTSIAPRSLLPLLQAERIQKADCLHIKT